MFGQISILHSLQIRVERALKRPARSCHLRILAGSITQTCPKLRTDIGYLPGKDLLESISIVLDTDEGI